MKKLVILIGLICLITFIAGCNEKATVEETIVKAPDNELNSEPPSPNEFDECMNACLERGGSGPECNVDCRSDLTVNEERCGDGVCSDREMNENVCPEDCI